MKIFNEFYLEKGTELFIYNNDYSDKIGAFTYQNNKNSNRFSTIPISSDEVILEYFEPLNIKGNSLINISSIIHGYKSIFSNSVRDYNDSEDDLSDSISPKASGWDTPSNSSSHNKYKSPRSRSSRTPSSRRRRIGFAISALTTSILFCKPYGRFETISSGEAVTLKLSNNSCAIIC